MPLFEYRCSSCHHLEEVLQKHDDPAPGVCPHCGKKKTMHKEMSLTSFQLKGGGWYKDLYASSSSTPAASSSASASEAKADAKPAKADKSEKKPKKAKSDGAAAA